MDHDTEVLLDRLQQVAELHDRAGHRDSVERFVLDHGREFPVASDRGKFLPWVRTPNLCFTNCLQLALMEKLIYVGALDPRCSTGVQGNSVAP